MVAGGLGGSQALRLFGLSGTGVAVVWWRWRWAFRSVREPYAGGGGRGPMTAHAPCRAAWGRENSAASASGRENGKEGAHQRHAASERRVAAGVLQRGRGQHAGVGPAGLNNGGPDGAGLGDGGAASDRKTSVGAAVASAAQAHIQNVYDGALYARNVLFFTTPAPADLGRGAEEGEGPDDGEDDGPATGPGDAGAGAGAGAAAGVNRLSDVFEAVQFLAMKLLPTSPGAARARGRADALREREGAEAAPPAAPDDGGPGGPGGEADVTKIDRFLEAVPLDRVGMLRVCSSLSSCTYAMGKITPELLYEKHRLRLVKKRMRSTATTALESGGDDGAGPARAARAAAVEDDDDYMFEVEGAQRLGPAGAGGAATALGPFRFNFGLGFNNDSEAVTKMLNDTMDYSESKWEKELYYGPPDGAPAAGAAPPSGGPADAAEGGPPQSVWTRATGPLTSAVGSAAESFSSSAAAYGLSRVTSTLVDAVSSAIGREQRAGGGDAAAAAPVAAPADGEAAREAGAGAKTDRKKDKRRKRSKRDDERYRAVVTSTKAPTEWFVADDDERLLRYFVIQGSDSIDCWRANLTFDPVPFENPALGISVHRGVYEAAVALYDEILPFVQAHLAAHPLDEPKLALTGHSLGGSLATVVGLMMVLRGDVPLSALTPIVTFGSAAAFCSDGCCTYCQHTGAEACDLDAGCSSILEKMDVPNDLILNVMMHMDIVPRAFACDYSLVVDIFKRLVAFKDHTCLMTGTRRVMYTPVGETYVLQPSTANAPQHPLLPDGLGIYRMRDPPAWESFGKRVISGGGGLWRRGGEEEEEEPSYVRSSSSVSGYRFRCASTLSEALFGLLNTPHPLDILADPNAYGPRGKISLYHNPYNYTSVLNACFAKQRR